MILLVSPLDFLPATKGMAMVSAVVPFLSDAFDTFRDIQFGGLCLQAEHDVVRLMGVASIVYVAMLHFLMLRDDVSAAELAATYLAVAYASPAPTEDLLPGFGRGADLGSIWFVCL